ncbi:uncharacterized protein [Coffea arabica]|uniref:Uncharacterized protein isoform X3 n=1 Tax=Coffea arabica TaxID=13443 RepID=A0A6P6SRQ6_COFAR|nr:uncharacterized protein LOC113694000 isoform X3 [Coffea arabica]
MKGRQLKGYFAINLPLHRLKFEKWFDAYEATSAGDHQLPAFTFLEQPEKGGLAVGIPDLHFTKFIYLFTEMEVRNGGEEIDRLERGLLLDSSGSSADSQSANDEEEEEETDHFDEEEPVLYTASFEEAEENFVNYQTAQWILYSLLLILAWGIGLFMLLYLPFRRYILRKHIRSRKLYVTPNAIVYKVIKPVPFPCFGVLKREKHIVLPSVADIAIEQGYLQSKFGVYSIRIENVGVRRPPSDDLQIQGIANPHAFRKAVLMRLSNIRSQAFSRQASAVEDTNSRLAQSSTASMSPSKFLRHDSSSHIPEWVILQKLEEVGSSVKRVQNLIEGRNSQIAEHSD